MFMIFSNLSMYIGSFAKLEQAKMCRTAKKKKMISAFPYFDTIWRTNKRRKMRKNYSL